MGGDNMTDKELRKAQKQKLDFEIGLRVKEVREKMKMTQEEFSVQLNVSAQYISDVERGVAGLSILVAADIHKYYCISSDWLLTGDTEKNDISDIIEKLRYLNKDQLELIEKNINNNLQMIALSDMQAKKAMLTKDE